MCGIAYNNKVGALKITYSLCKHYYDKGIPDDPWYISPGKDGSSIQYFPNFSEEHWMRQYWFIYFADAYNLKVFSTWDSIFEIINEYYQYNYIPRLGFTRDVMNRLSTDKPILYNLIDNVQQNELFVEAKKYRVAAAHGTSAGNIRNTVKSQRDVWTEVAEEVDGKKVMKKVKATKVITFGTGEYTKAKDIMTNIESFAKYLGSKISEIIELMECDRVL